MSVPDKYKANFELYRKFLKALAPTLAEIYMQIGDLPF
jgi:hypothetical protein